MPKPMYYTLIIGPVVGIIILIALTAFRNSQEPPEPPADPNVVVSDLQREIPALQKESSELYQLFQKEDPTAKARFEALRDKYYNWIDRWDAIFEPKRDPNTGKLPPELEGYKNVRAEVSRQLGDLSKIAPF
jgi:hypothetical protein